MEKQLTFEFEGSKYTLAFNRKTVQILEKQGFYPEMLTKQPATGIPLLFKGAFLVHHRGIKEDLTDKMLRRLKNTDELMAALIEMYAEPINALLATSEDEGGEEKNVEWGKNF